MSTRPQKRNKPEGLWLACAGQKRAREIGQHDVSADAKPKPIATAAKRCVRWHRPATPALGAMHCHFTALLPARPRCRHAFLHTWSPTGRVRPGHCFRLCTLEDYDRLLPAASVPEVQRSDLTAMVLQLKVNTAAARQAT